MPGIRETIREALISAHFVKEAQLHPIRTALSGPELTRREAFVNIGLTALEIALGAAAVESGLLTKTLETFGDGVKSVKENGFLKPDQLTVEQFTKDPNTFLGGNPAGVTFTDGVAQYIGTKELKHESLDGGLKHIFLIYPKSAFEDPSGTGSTSAIIGLVDDGYGDNIPRFKHLQAKAETPVTSTTPLPWKHKGHTSELLDLHDEQNFPRTNSFVSTDKHDEDAWQGILELAREGYGVDPSPTIYVSII